VRLLPALWVNLVFWLLVGVVAELAGKHYLTDIGKNVAASFLYVYHLFFPVSMELIRGVPAGHDAERVLSPLWTLSIEEHFYLVVPLLVVFAMKRNLVKTLAATLAAIWLGINVHRLLGYTGPLMDPTAPAFVRLMWMARPEALLVGSALALVNAHIPESFTDRHRKVLLPVGCDGAGGMAAVDADLAHTDPRPHLNVVLLATRPRDRVARQLRQRSRRRPVVLLPLQPLPQPGAVPGGDLRDPAVPRLVGASPVLGEAADLPRSAVVHVVHLALGPDRPRQARRSRPQLGRHDGVRGRRERGRWRCRFTALSSCPCWG
jgi:hypothetical protein